ncbi:hypothetical protein TB2_034263 [Malus domestica]
MAACRSCSAFRAVWKILNVSRTRSKADDARTMASPLRRPSAPRSFRHTPSKSRPLHSRTCDDESARTSRSWVRALGSAASVGAAEGPDSAIVLERRALNSTSHEACTNK